MQIAAILIHIVKTDGYKNITILNLYCFLLLLFFCLSGHISLHTLLFFCGKIRLTLSERVTFLGIPFEFINKITILFLICLASAEF